MMSLNTDGQLIKNLLKEDHSAIRELYSKLSDDEILLESDMVEKFLNI
jgi:hypothetical protein